VRFVGATREGLAEKTIGYCRAVGIDSTDGVRVPSTGDDPRLARLRARDHAARLPVGRNGRTCLATIAPLPMSALGGREPCFRSTGGATCRGLATAQEYPRAAATRIDSAVCRRCLVHSVTHNVSTMQHGVSTGASDVVSRPEPPEPPDPRHPSLTPRRSRAVSRTALPPVRAGIVVAVRRGHQRPLPSSTRRDRTRPTCRL